MQPGPLALVRRAAASRGLLRLAAQTAGLTWRYGTWIPGPLEELPQDRGPLQALPARLPASDDPAGDTLVLEEGDRRFSLGTGSTRDAAFVVIGLHSTNTSEWLAIRSDNAAGRAAAGAPAPGGGRIRRRSPHAGLRRARLVRGPHQRRGSGLSCRRRPRRRARLCRHLARDRGPPTGRARGGRRRVRGCPGPERADRGADPGPCPPTPRARRPLHGRPARVGLDHPVHRQPLVDLAGRQPRAGCTGPAHRPHLARHTVERPAGGPGGAGGDAAQTGARTGRLRPVPLRAPTGRGPSHPTGRGSRSRWSTGPTSLSPPPPSSTATAPTRSASTRRSRIIGSRSSTVAPSSPSRTCAEVERWDGPGTRAAGWSTRPTRSRTSLPARAT